MPGKPSAAAVARMAEPVEVDAWADFCEHAPPDVVAEARIGTAREGDVLASRASKYDVVAINRVVGLGVTAPATELQLERMLAIH